MGLYGPLFIHYLVYQRSNALLGITDAMLFAVTIYRYGVGGL